MSSSSRCPAARCSDASRPSSAESNGARATSGRKGAGSMNAPLGERASISPSVKSSSRSPRSSLPRAVAGSTPRPRRRRGVQLDLLDVAARGQQHGCGMAAGDDVEAAVGLDVDEDGGHELLGVQQVRRDPPVDLPRHVRDVARTGGRGAELAQHHGGRADRREALAADVADQQPHRRRPRDDLVEVAADLRLGRRGEVAHRQRDGTGPGGRLRQDRALDGLRDQGDAGQALGLLLERRGRVEGEGHPVAHLLQEREVRVAVAAPRLGVDQRHRPDDAVASGQRCDDRAGEPQAPQDRQVLLADGGGLDQLGGDERVDLAASGADDVRRAGGGVHAGREGARDGARPLGGLGVAVLHGHASRAGRRAAAAASTSRRSVARGAGPPPRRWSPGPGCATGSWTPRPAAPCAGWRRPGPAAPRPAPPHWSALPRASAGSRPRRPRTCAGGKVRASRPYVLPSRCSDSRWRLRSVG